MKNIEVIIRNSLLRKAFLVCASLAALNAGAQTLNIYTGHVKTAVTATADQLPFSDGTYLTACSKAFAISDIDSMVVDTVTVEDNTILVEYDGDEAYVTIAGNIAQYMTTEINGAHVAIVQSADVTEELTYTLQGSSSDGSFWMDGELKISLVLNGLTLTCADSAAINIRDGKRISVELVDGTVNTLVDGADGDQKGCFVINGHGEFKGGGELNLTGNTKHALFGDEYVELKKSTGTINVLSAVKDGFNINQYFEMKGGVVNISNIGDDGIQVSYTDDDTDEYNGQVIISGGDLNIDITATAAKGIKCDDAMTVSGGTFNITTSGGGEYDSDDQDCSACACIKADGVLTISGGNFDLTSTGKGGKGISSDSDMYISGDTINVTTTGATYTYGSSDALPKAIKSDASLYISGGIINVSATGGDGAEGIESKDTLAISGGEIVINSYDDAINATTNIDISGGKIYACATNNDAIDSNGTMYISGGLVLACSTDEPEGPFDCDENTFSVTGGTIVGIGGDSSSPSSSLTTQPIVVFDGSSYTKDTYLAFNNDTANVFVFLIPRTYSTAELFVSSPHFVLNETYVIYKDADVTLGTEWNGYSDDSTVNDGTALSSVTLSSYVVQQTVNGSDAGFGNPGGTTGMGGSTGGSSGGMGGSSGGMGGSGGSSGGMGGW